MPWYQKHLLVTLSSHGYGHAVMTAALINQLQKRYPELKITLRTTLPRPFLEGKFHAPFKYLPQSCDVGMLMNSAFAVDRPNTLQAYRAFHADWQGRIADEQRILSAIAPDLVISNIAYLPLVAAQQLGIPAIAMSCLNWADIFTYFFPDENAIHQQIVAAYRSANCFIRTQPTMPMSELTTRTVAPLAAIGNNQRQQLMKALNLAAATQLVLVSMGGIKTELNAPRWPVLDNIHYIAANAVDEVDRPDITPIEALNISYNDLLSSCDLLLTKPGYGSFTEAACNNMPVLYVCRDEWPEQRYMTEWLRQQVPCTKITLEQFMKGEFSRPLQQLLQTARPTTTPTTGVEEAIEIIVSYLKP